MTAMSTTPGTSVIRSWLVSPSTSSARGLTAWIAPRKPASSKCLRITCPPLSGLRLAPITATERGWSTARTLSASAECSRASRTSSDRAVGAISKPRLMTPSSYRWVIA